MNQLHAQLYPSLLTLPPKPSIPQVQVTHSTELSPLRYITASHQLAILHMVVNIC